MDIKHFRNSLGQVREKTASVRDAAIKAFRQLPMNKLSDLSGHDFYTLFILYDTEFFGGWISEQIKNDCRYNLNFRVSQRMSRRAGFTRRFISSKGNSKHITYEIVISGSLLQQLSNYNRQSLVVCGIKCTNSLEVLLRVFEHELVHLLEFFIWGNSCCSKPMFRFLAVNIFAHTNNMLHWKLHYAL